MCISEKLVKVQHPNVLIRWYGNALLGLSSLLLKHGSKYGTMYEWIDEPCCGTCASSWIIDSPAGCGDCSCGKE